MKFIELAEKRCSIRGYRSDSVPEELLNKILLAGNLAPTAKNLQPFHFIVVRDPAKLDELAASCPAPFFARHRLLLLSVLSLPKVGCAIGMMAKTTVKLMPPLPLIT